MDITKTDVSVIVPVYNMQQYLKQAIDSILSQNCNCEIIIIDDASTDGSAKIIRKYTDKYNNIKAQFLSKNAGPGNARNIGLKIASGNYVRFLDPDDYYPPNSLKLLLDLAIMNNADVAAGNIASLIETEGRLVYKNNSVETFKSNGSGSLQQIPQLWVPLHHHRYLFKKEFLTKNGICYPDLKRGQDPVMLAHVLTTVNKVYYTNEVVYIHRSFGSKSSCFNYLQLTETIRHFILVFQIYFSAQKEFYAYLHLCNKMGLITNFDCNNFNDDEIEKISELFCDLFKEMDINKLITYDFSPYEINPVNIWFCLGLAGASRDQVKAIIKSKKMASLCDYKKKKTVLKKKLNRIKRDDLVIKNVKAIIRNLFNIFNIKV